MPRDEQSDHLCYYLFWSLSNVDDAGRTPFRRDVNDFDSVETCATNTNARARLLYGCDIIFTFSFVCLPPIVAVKSNNVKKSHKGEVRMRNSVFLVDAVAVVVIHSTHSAPLSLFVPLTIPSYFNQFVDFLFHSSPFSYFAFSIANCVHSRRVCVLCVYG